MTSTARRSPAPIATGTHGTGARLQGIAAAVCGLTLVLADGSTLECSHDVEPEVFQAARVGLGALGVVTEVELQCVPAFRLHAKETGAPLSALLPRLQAEADAHDHLDLHWFPHTDRVLVKRNDRVGPGEGPSALAAWRGRIDDDLLANRAFEGLNRVGARWPAAVPTLNRVGSRVLGSREFTDDSWKVFCSSREVRFVESEYAVPRASVEAVLVELRAWFGRTREPVTFPVEVRFVGADDVWLSTAHERDNAYVAVHQYHRMDPRPLFAAFEAIVAEHEGRPHWGRSTRWAPTACARSTPGSTTSWPCATGWTPGACSPTTTSAASWETEPVPPRPDRRAARASPLVRRHAPGTCTGASTGSRADASGCGAPSRAGGAPCGSRRRGAAPGEPRSVILGYVEDGPNLVTLAMNGWSPGEPAWWLNLRDTPHAEVVVRGGSFRVSGRAAHGEERDRLWARWREIDENLDGFAALRPTETAVVVLEPVPAAP